MNKKYKAVISLAILGIAVVVIFLIDSINRKTYLSSQTGTGNTPANIYNGGFFCEQGDSIFFSNPYDDGTLYRMNSSFAETEKVYNDKVRYINADENYIYYARINNMKEEASAGIFIFRNNGVYRINHSGSKIKMLYMDPAGQLILYRNIVYYQHYNEKNGLNLYHVNIDATEDTKITEEMIPVAAIHGDFLYYTHEGDSELYRMSLNNYTTSSFLKKKAYMPVPTDKGIYFISLLDNYSLCQVDFAGENVTKVVSGIVSTYNISSDGRYIYYQQDGTDHNGIHEYDTFTGDDTVIQYGDYKWFNVAGGSLFFYDFDESNVYRYSRESGAGLFYPK